MSLAFYIECIECFSDVRKQRLNEGGDHPGQRGTSYDCVSVSVVVCRGIKARYAYGIMHSAFGRFRLQSLQAVSTISPSGWVLDSVVKDASWVVAILLWHEKEGPSVCS